VASEERAHAAAVRAAEEVALRRVDEKKRMASKQDRSAASGDTQRKSLKQARERASEAERKVSEIDGEITTLTTTLDDPELYATPAGVEQAHKLGARLDALRARLDKALSTWEQETAALERLERAAVP
jgi:DNA repair exonuclease SbcCD ATPase subunit